MTSGFQLPPAPVDQTGPVKAWAQAVVIPTYLPRPADKNPMFLEKRVYQGSSGRVYPLPFIDRIAEEKTDRSWEAIHIENEFIRIMILPELGGRIHVGLDKTNGYDFFYRQNVIKPALVGLAGPWVSGGVEFNWPQHHRPSTFMRADWEIQRHPDGSVTLWCGEYEPMNRMKGMHGVCLHPGSSLLELKVRLYNRTEFVQTFLWWANAAVRVHDKYQSFFPPDVTVVADHAKRAMSRFPLCDGTYYGVDYGERSRKQEAGSKKDGMAANDLSWYANIPVPTSYMAIGSKEDFFGGYDHSVAGGGAGLVHVADHHIAPGKKQWTWGNHEFGYAWDRNLSDDAGPYIELMAGVFTDNQPDFSYLMPGETRAWSQYWYPIRAIGPAQKANLDAAVSLSVQGKKIRIGVASTRVQERVLVQLWRGDVILHQCPAMLSPASPLVQEYVEPAAIPETELRLYVLDHAGRILIQYQPAAPAEKTALPPAAKEPALPADVANVEELYLIGVHLEQYRHATRLPEDYWLEALQRDPGESRCNTALAWWHLRRGEFGKAVDRFKTAIATLTKFNPNPRDGEAFYGLGIALRYLNRLDEAYDALAKAAWNSAWQSPAFYALAQIDFTRRDFIAALEHLDRARSFNTQFSQAHLLFALAWRERKQPYSAKIFQGIVNRVLAQDPLDPMARFLVGKPLTCPTQTRLDIALEFARCALYENALNVLKDATPELESGTAPLVHYYRAFFHDKLNQGDRAAQERAAGKQAPSDYCFPARLEEIAILLAASSADAADSRAPYYLGNLLYDRRRREEAITWWEKSAKLDRGFSIPWRNLGIAYFNVFKDIPAAKGAYERAFRANLSDARLLYERDQLWKRTGEPPERRLEELENHPGLVMLRDDLMVEWFALLNQTGQHDRALALLKTRKFQPWEGGEGLALGQWQRTHIALGRKALWQNEIAAARQLFAAGLAGAPTLGEAAHLLANQSELHYWIGMAARSGNDTAAAEHHFKIAAQSTGDFRNMAVCAFSETSIFSGMALRELGQHAAARQFFEAMEAYALKLAAAPARIDYFATSLPTMLLFEDDPHERQQTQAKLLQALALWGLGDKKTARRFLGDILRENPSHGIAADLLGSVPWD